MKRKQRAKKNMKKARARAKINSSLNNSLQGGNGFLMRSMMNPELKGFGIENQTNQSNSGLLSDLTLLGITPAKNCFDTEMDVDKLIQILGGEKIFQMFKELDHKVDTPEEQINTRVICTVETVERENSEWKRKEALLVQKLACLSQEKNSLDSSLRASVIEKNYINRRMLVLEKLIRHLQSQIRKLSQRNIKSESLNKRESLLLMGFNYHYTHCGKQISKPVHHSESEISTKTNLERREVISKAKSSVIKIEKDISKFRQRLINLGSQSEQSSQVNQNKLLDSQFQIWKEMAQRVQNLLFSYGSKQTSLCKRLKQIEQLIAIKVEDFSENSESLNIENNTLLDLLERAEEECATTKKNTLIKLSETERETNVCRETNVKLENTNQNLIQEINNLENEIEKRNLQLEEFGRIKQSLLEETKQLQAQIQTLLDQIDSSNKNLETANSELNQLKKQNSVSKSKLKSQSKLILSLHSQCVN